MWFGRTPARTATRPQQLKSLIVARSFLSTAAGQATLSKCKHTRRVGEAAAIVGDAVEGEVRKKKETPRRKAQNMRREGDSAGAGGDLVMCAWRSPRQRCARQKAAVWQLHSSRAGSVAWRGVGRRAGRPLTGHSPAIHPHMTIGPIGPPANLRRVRDPYACHSCSSGGRERKERPTGIHLSMQLFDSQDEPESREPPRNTKSKCDAAISWVYCVSARAGC